MKKLLDRHQRFVDEYLVDLNAAQAAIRAGYARPRAALTGYELLRKPHVAAAIETAKITQAKRTRITADRVLEYLVDMITADIQDITDECGLLKPVSDWPKIYRQTCQVLDVKEFYEDGTTRKVKGRISKVRFPDRLKALEWIGKHVAVQAFKEAEEKHFHIGSLSEATTEQLVSLLREIDGQIDRTRTIETKAIN